MSLPDTAPDLERTLRDRFGLEHFRAGQREVIENVLQGRDVLCVMPTGGGKSLCYQLPALLLPGLTLVVSPLIALMKDQVDALIQRGVRATLLNSTLDPAVQLARIHEIEEGRYDLVYVAPERFRSNRFAEAMARVKPVLLAIDEAHCISQWGHDFRPDYARIGLARRKLGAPPCIALTATATDLVRRDIADQLDLRDPAVFVTGFDRPNLTYAVIEGRRENEKLQIVAKALDENPGSAIIYASSRNKCVMVADHVSRELKKQAVVYHAGLTRDERTSAQERFMAGDAEVVVATNAFGMGVDKPDIRSVIHYNFPGTLEAYYQEAGRAGRDGLPAQCLLIFAPGDRMLQEMFIENEYPPPDLVYQVFNYLRGLQDDPIERTQLEIKNEARIEQNESAVGTALRLLEGAGAIERFLPRENMAIVRINAEGDEPGSLLARVGPQAHIQRTVLLGLEGLVNRRYSEPVYFHPDDFATALGLDRPALVRAIKALTSELPIDYVPPFRGNAVRVIDRATKIRDLAIDFAALQKRKQREYDKLDRMITYAQTKHCRRSYILGYFGDARADQVHCGRCDNCGGTAAASLEVIDTEHGREVILKVLSGVARTKGRFGKTIVAQMLRGARSEKLKRGGLEELSTYGILPGFSESELKQIIDALSGAGLVECPEIDRFRPIVNLSQRGWELLKSRSPSPLALALPEDLAAKVRQLGRARELVRSDTTGVVSDPSVATVDGDPLHESLKALRLEWSKEEKKPAYTFFTNETLDTLVRMRPKTPRELALVKGLGPARIERYGADLLAVIAAFSEQPDAPKPAEPSLFDEPIGEDPPPPPPVRSVPVPTEEWTRRLLAKGFGIDEVAAIRGIDRSAVIRHVTLSARQGNPVSPQWFLTTATIRRWDAWRDDHGEGELPPDHDENGDLWPLYLACRGES